MAVQAACRSAAVVRVEAEGTTRAYGSTPARPGATAEPRGRCPENARWAATLNLLVLSGLRSTLAENGSARHCRRDVVAATVCRNFDCYARRPARECCVAAGMDA